MTDDQRARQRFRQNKLAVASAWFLLAVVALVLVWPLVAPFSPDALTDEQFRPPGWRHWFGTDVQDRKSTRLNSSHGYISYAVFCLKKKKTHTITSLSAQQSPSRPHTRRKRPTL